MATVDVIIRTIDQSKGGMDGFSASLAKTAAQYISVGAAATAAVKFVADSVKSTLDYADSVRTLSAVSGQSTEATSRFIQVLDDYKISTNDVMAATRAMTKQGVAPTIESLAALSDEYLSLGSAQERNEFILKNLGKGGLQWVEVLNKGSAALKAQGAAVSASLILSQKQVDAARANEIALDNWNDSIEGLKIAIGNGLIPAMTGVVDEANNTVAAIQIMQEQGMSWLQILDHMAVNSSVYTDALKQASEATLANRDAMLENADAADLNTQSTEAAAEAARSLSEKHEMFLGVLGQFEGPLAALREGLAATDAQLAAGEITLEEHRAAVAGLSAEYEAAKNKIVLSIVEMKLASDGWTDAELNAYLNIGTQMGVFTAEQKVAAQGAINLANKMLDAVDPINHVGERAEDAGEGFGVMADGAEELGDRIGETALPAVSGLKTQINGLPPTGTQWNYAINIDVSGQVPNLPAGGVWNNGNGTVNVGGGVMGECFVAGTLVAMADGSIKPIEQIQEGDEIRSWHEGRFITVKVAKVFSHVASEAATLVRLNGVLTGTQEHLIYTDGNWLPLGFLRRGDALLIDGKRAEVTNIELVPGFIPVYNLETDHESHNYFANGILVHNGKAMGGMLNPGAFTVVGEGPNGWSPTAEVVYNGMVIPHHAAQWMKDAGMLNGAGFRASGGPLRGENLLPPTRDKDELDRVRIEQNEIAETELASQTVAAETAAFIAPVIQDVMQTATASSAQQVSNSNQMVQQGQTQIALLRQIAANSNPVKNAKANAEVGLAGF